MKTHKLLRYILIALMQTIVLTIFNYSYASDVTNAINWQQWNADVFHQAKKENKLVLLNLEAVWCHWCHVMDKKTYSEKNIISKLEKNYIAVKVDHDANPGLANQYRDYGWPATIIFDADGNEIVKRAGYIKADNMTRLLTAVVEDPSPENIKSTLLSQSKSLLKKGSVSLSDDLHSDLIQRHRSAYDEVKGGLKLNQKFLDRDSVEYSMSQAQRGNNAEARRAKHSLTAALNLLDPEWGGFYQYSTQGNWQHAHYEKIMRVQASYLRLYALAYAQFPDANYLHATEEIRRYLNRFLKADSGVYFVSQDADLIQGEHSDVYFALSSRERLTEAGILLIDKELATDPIHITIIGDKKDAVAEDLFITALNKASWFKRVEWWDRKEGDLPNADVAYPVLNRSAAFLCTDNLCSLPVFSAEALNELINRIDEETILTSEFQPENVQVEKVSSSIYPQTDNFIYFHSEIVNNSLSVVL